MSDSPSSATEFSFSFSRRAVWLIALVLFAVSLAVRLPALDQFVTIDEPRWVERSREFALGLVESDFTCGPAYVGRTFEAQGLACTFQGGYPGVLTMWSGTAGILLHYWQTAPPDTSLTEFVTAVSFRPVDPVLLAKMRLPMLVVAALFPPLFFLLTRRLFSEWVALLAAVLIALGPFYIALSRVLHHDMLTAMFMVLSLLAMVGYWVRGWSLRWLLLSAGFAGLAILCKPVSWFILPTAAMVGWLGLFFRYRTDRWQGWPAEVRRVIATGLAWGLGVAVTFVALFPAMWVIPLQTLTDIIYNNVSMAEAGHSKGHYFLGQVVTDPGPLFYPVGWVFRASPFELVGLGAVLILGLLRLRRHWPLSRPKLAQFWRTYPVEITLALFVVTFFIFVSLSNKKMIRYSLPYFPVLNVFIAMGLLWLTESVINLRRYALPTLLGGVMLVQGWFIFQHTPYFFTYYNPLVGGARVADQTMTTIGWGEGMDAVAEFLNQQENPAELRVSAWYNHALDPFFVGKANDFSPTRINAMMQADYLVYYRNQIQREQYAPDLLTYFQNRTEPVYTLNLHGIEYAQVYQNPIVHRVEGEANGLSDVLTTLGYNLGERGDLTLFWRTQDFPAGHLPALGLADSQTAETRWVLCPPKAEFANLVSQMGAIIESKCQLPSVPPDGIYDLRLGLSDSLTVPNLVAVSQFPAGELAVFVDSMGVVQNIDRETALALLAERAVPTEAGATALNLLFGDIAWLVGYQFSPQTWQADQDNQLKFYWQPTPVLDAEFAGAFQMALRLYPAESEITTPLITDTLAFLPPQESITPGLVLPTPYTLTLPADTPAGAYRLEACLQVVNGQPVFGVTPDESTVYECLPLTVTVSAVME